MSDTFQDFIHDSTPANKHIIKALKLVDGIIACKIIYASNLRDKVCRLGISRIANELGISKSTVSRSLDQLIKDGYITMEKERTNLAPSHYQPTDKLFNLLPSGVAECNSGVAECNQDKNKITSNKEKESEPSPLGKTNGAKPTKEPLADILEYANKGVSEETAPNPQDQYWQRRDPALRVAQVNLGQFNQVEKSDILALVAMPDFEPPRWELAVMDTARHYKGQGKVARAIEMYHAGGSYEAWRRKTYEQETPIKPTEKLSFGAV